MPQRRKNLGFANRVGLVAFSLLLAITPTVSVAQDRLRGYDSREAIEAKQLPVETAITADLRVPQFETSSVIAAALCFAVGFGACLLVVHSMLPSLVHVQCVEIVREYLDHTGREPDIRVVVLDRENHAPLQKPTRVRVPVEGVKELGQAPGNYPNHQGDSHVRSEPVPVFHNPVANSISETSYESQHHLRVDTPTAPAGYAQVGPLDSHSEDAPNSMLSRIYEQNLHLRDQLREQSRSIKQ